MRRLMIAGLLFPLSARAGIQEWALHDHSLRMCATVPHASGDGCKAEVERRFPRCVGPFLAHETNATQFASCLGFTPPPEAKRLAECKPPRIRLHLSLSLARTTPWANSRERTIDGRLLHVAASHILDEHDLETVGLEDRGGDRTLVLGLSPDGAARLASATAANLGSWMVIDLHGDLTAAHIEGAINGRRLVLPAGALPLERICAR